MIELIESENKNRIFQIEKYIMFLLKQSYKRSS